MPSLLSSLSLLSTLLLFSTSTTANPIAAPPNSRSPALLQPLPFSTPPPNPAPTSLNPSTNPSLSPNLTSSNSSSEYGINCNGSPIGCIGAATTNVMHVLRDYMSVLKKYNKVRYVAGQKIACKEHSIFPFVVHGYFCAFLEGQNVPAKGVGGELLRLKMQQMIEHGCQGCGSVPLEDGNDPSVMGKLTVNFVRQSECVGLCFYGDTGFIQEIRFEDDTAQGAAAASANRDSRRAAGDGGKPVPAVTSTTTEEPSIVSVRYIPAVTWRPLVPGQTGDDIIRNGIRGER